MKKIGHISYINIQGGMIYNLGLSGNELLLYALIYGYTQDGKNEFHGSITYIENGLQLSRPSVISLLQKLQDKGLIVKTKESHYMASQESLLLASKECLLPSKETLLPASKETLPNIYNNINNNINIIGKSKPVISVNEKISEAKQTNQRTMLQIVNEYESIGSFSLNEISPANALDEYEEESLTKLANLFLSYYCENKEKISKPKTNVRARFNKFIISDYHNILVKKPKWPGLDNVTDEEFMELLRMGYLKSPNCKLYSEVIVKELDTEAKRRLFSTMVRFFTNKHIEAYKTVTFKEFAIKNGYLF